MSLLTRNFAFVLSSPRRAYRVTRLCRQHVASHPECRWCRAIKDLEAHHIVPLWHCVDLAEDPRNLITLCRRCHMVVGHFYHYGTMFCPNVVQLCDARNITMRIEEPDATPVCTPEMCAVAF